MNKELVNTTIEIMGKTYQIKCQAHESTSLKQSARYLENKMLEMREAGNLLSLDKIAVITALNIVHQFLNIENYLNEKNIMIQQRIEALHDKVQNALADGETFC